MVDLVVVGSVAFDSIETPYGSRERVLGGSACYFSYVASFFCKVGMVGIVGKDFPDAFLQPLRDRGVDTSGLRRDEERNSFFWKGRYEGDMNVAQTVDVELNVLGDFMPELPKEYRKAPYVFLANSHPATQLSVLKQFDTAPLVCSDSMNMWIENESDTLNEVLSNVEGFFCNDAEAKMLAGTPNLIQAGRNIMSKVKGFVGLKKGEHGSILFHREGLVGLPAFPADEVLDPTGAGDSFAGGFMGSMARLDKSDIAAMKESVVYGTAMASFTVEGFGLEKLFTLEEHAISQRRKQLLDFLPAADR